ncbi:MAG: hypothetical protein ACHQ0J_05065 [Candidatus Dormibacterales bacterium]
MTPEEYWSQQNLAAQDLRVQNVRPGGQVDNRDDSALKPVDTVDAAKPAVTLEQYRKEEDHS